MKFFEEHITTSLTQLMKQKKISWDMRLNMLEKCINLVQKWEMRTLWRSKKYWLKQGKDDITSKFTMVCKLNVQKNSLYIVT